MVNLGTSDTARTFADDEDVIINMPNATQNGLAVEGGRHIRIIGGYSVHRLLFENVRGSVFIEGVHIDRTSAGVGDAIWVGTTDAGGRPDVYVQNCRVEGVTGSGANHGDVLQLHGPIGAVRIDRLSGGSEYQGIFMGEVGADVAGPVDLRYVNMFAEGSANFLKLLYLFEEGVTEQPFDLSMTDVFMRPGTGRSLADKVYPIASVNRFGCLVVANETGTFDWATGDPILVGPDPADDDYVTSSDAGLGYTSPGYA